MNNIQVSPRSQEYNEGPSQNSDQYKLEEDFLPVSASANPIVGAAEESKEASIINRSCSSGGGI